MIDINGQELYSIGQFAEIGNVSIKQLRYLEQKRILQPDVRNPENNYRYYSEKQLDKLVYIKNLRSLGVELNQIMDLANSGSLQDLIDTLRGNLNVVKKEISDAIQKYDNIVEHLMHINNFRAVLKELTLRNAQHDIETVNIPDKLLLFIRDDYPANVKRLFIDRLERLKKYAADHDLLIEGPMISIFHANYTDLYSDSYFDYETAFEIKGDTAIDAGNRRFVRKFKALQGISAIHVGDYKNVWPLYKRMVSWAEENSIRLSGTVIEEYILWPDLVSNPEEYVTRLILPIIQ